MVIPTKKIKNGFEMPAYGLGTWQMSGRYEPTPVSHTGTVRAIKSAIDAGIKHIDTAEMYAQGLEEELIGQAIAGLRRENLFITSKVWPSHWRHDAVIAACQATLSRLHTPYLDLYLIHWPNTPASLPETLEALAELKNSGLIKNIGVSNFSKELLDEAQRHTRHKIVTNQVHYSLQYRWPESSGLLEYCQKNDVLLTAYRPVERGSILDEKIPVMKFMMEKYNKTPAQVAINWLISQHNVITIAKTSSPQHLHENLGATGWRMAEEDVEALRREFPRQITAPDAGIL